MVITALWPTATANLELAGLLSLRMVHVVLPMVEQVALDLGLVRAVLQMGIVATGWTCFAPLVARQITVTVVVQDTHAKGLRLLFYMLCSATLLSTQI
jgi:hypothetical protein